MAWYQTLKETAVYFDRHNALRPRTESVVGHGLTKHHLAGTGITPALPQRGPAS
jgi:hypothetical protein